VVTPAFAGPEPIVRPKSTTVRTSIASYLDVSSHWRGAAHVVELLPVRVLRREIRQVHRKSCSDRLTCRPRNLFRFRLTPESGSQSAWSNHDLGAGSGHRPISVFLYRGCLGVSKYLSVCASSLLDSTRNDDGMRVQPAENTLIQSVPGGVGCGGCPRVDAKLAEDVGDVGLGCAERDVELLRDLRVRFSFDEQAQHVPLAWGQC